MSNERSVFDQYEDQHPGFDASEEFYAAIGSSMQTVEDWDMVNNPKHYQKNGMEVIDIIEAFTPDPYSYYMGNATKYLLRHMDKGNPEQDLQKCQWYITKMLEDWRYK